jgi:glycosyltransferase involved in cell wall biosynthesis
MPVYNTEKYVDRAIQSVLNQTYQKFCLVIIDDASTDNSFEIIQRYKNHPKVIILSNERNGGCFYSKNRGFKYMESGNFDVYTSHDADDYSDPTRFENVMKSFEDELIIGCLTGEERIGDPLPKWFGDRISVTMSHAFYSKQAFKALGYFDNTLCQADLDFWTRLQKYVDLSKKYKHTSSDHILYHAEVTGENMINIYDIPTRLEYQEKSRKEIDKMLDPKDFYRPFFSIEESVKNKK